MIYNDMLVYDTDKGETGEDITLNDFIFQLSDALGITPYVYDEESGERINHLIKTDRQLVDEICERLR